MKYLLILSTLVLFSCSSVVVEDKITDFKYKAGQQVLFVNSSFYDLCVARVVYAHTNYRRFRGEKSKKLYNVQIRCPGIDDQTVVADESELTLSRGE